MTVDTATNETVELMQVMIRNACVNDGRPESGEEVRSSDTLQAYLEGTGLDLEIYEPTPGRRSRHAITVSDTAARRSPHGPHDVVPVSPTEEPDRSAQVRRRAWGARAAC